MGDKLGIAHFSVGYVIVKASGAQISEKWIFIVPYSARRLETKRSPILYRKAGAMPHRLRLRRLSTFPLISRVKLIDLLNGHCHDAISL